MENLYNLCRNMRNESFNVNYNGETIIDGGLVKRTLMTLYPSWFCLADTSSDLLDRFNDYNLLYAYNLYKSLEAFNSEYDPISNYDSNIVETWNYGERKETNVTGQAHSTNITQPTTSTTTNQTTTADDVNVFKNREKNTTETNTITADIDTDERTDTRTDSAREDKRTYTQSGNIGVTTSQQMIESSLNLYAKNPILEYIKRFVYLYCFNFS